MRLFFALLTSLCLMNSALAFQRYQITEALLKPLPHKIVKMDYSRAYMGKTMAYECVSMQSLLKKLHVKKTNIIELIAKDNFSVYVPAHLFFETDPKQHSIGYLAIEPKTFWPKLFNNIGDTAGPYQVIWTHPEISHISDEYWAWSVTNIAIHQTFPKDMLIPAPKTKRSSVLKGHQLYISHCAACHNIDNIGKAVIGPDLSGKNAPFTAYPSRQKLAAFIRNPNQFRSGRMSGSSIEGLPDQQLENLIDYFEFLATTKSVQAK